MLLRYLFIFCLVFGCSSSLEMEDSILPSLQYPDFQEAEVRQAVGLLKAAMRNLSVYLVELDNTKEMPPKCLKIQCRFICSNGRQEDIARDISMAMTAPESEPYCPIINELHLYNYSFPNAVVPVGFLNIYTHRIQLIFISISNIVAFENGAFADGIFEYIILENLRLKSIGKEFFANISKEFKGISILQQNLPLETVYPDYLDYVTFQIEMLRLSTGLECVRNVTATYTTLGKVTYADFSFNNFGDDLQDDTFNKLTTVEILVLANSKIKFLPSYIFSGMYFLKLLDLSHNQLTTISETIFGKVVPSNLNIYVNSNNWHCDCNLQTELDRIYIHQTTPADIYCATPEEFKDWMVMDNRICEEFTITNISTTTKTTTSLYTTTTTSLPRTTTTESMANQDSEGPTIPTIAPNEIITLECASADYLMPQNRHMQNIWLPQIQFFPTAYGALTVKITVEWSEIRNTFGLAWFSKTTKEYYMMELLQEDFDLGCYYTMPRQTVVTNLVPNVAYTFCLLDAQLTKVSPFSCKSLHISGNLNTNYNSWLSTNMRSKGISLMVIGIVMFMFIGITIVLLILKHKPIWLKGSKRIIKSKHSSGDIVVLPRSNTAKRLQHKENMISRFNQQQFLAYNSRHDPMYSPASSNSYMEANLYEVIPAYITFDKVPQADAPSQPDFDLYDWPTPLAQQESVRYTKITPRSKRDSSDPLPALPSEVSDVPEQ